MSTKVYILIKSYDYEGSRVLSVWSSREAAEAELAEHDHDTPSYISYHIAEFEVQS